MDAGIVPTELRRFYQRCILGSGIVWGFQLLLTLPFVSIGKGDTVPVVWAVVLNSLTVCPACLLAFWHRRIACLWLVLNAFLILIAVVNDGDREKFISFSRIVGLLVPVLLAIALAIMELRRWPGALSQKE